MYVIFDVEQNKAYGDSDGNEFLRKATAKQAKEDALPKKYKTDRFVITNGLEHPKGKRYGRRFTKVFSLPSQLVTVKAEKGKKKTRERTFSFIPKWNKKGLTCTACGEYRSVKYTRTADQKPYCNACILKVTKND